MEIKLKSLIVLFKAHQSLINNVKLSLQNTELSVNEFTVMEALATKKELSTQQVIDLILIPNSSLTYILDILEEKNYINRLKDKNDRRRQLLSLTPLGLEIFTSIYEKHFNHMQSIFQVLSPQQHLQLQELLKTLGKKAEQVFQECDI